MNLMDILLETQRDLSAEVKISRKDIKSFLFVSSFITYAMLSLIHGFVL